MSDPEKKGPEDHDAGSATKSQGGAQLKVGAAWPGGARTIQAKEMTQIPRELESAREMTNKFEMEERIVPVSCISLARFNKIDAEAKRKLTEDITRLVAKHLDRGSDAYFYVATPPIYSLRLLISLVATRHSSRGAV